MSPLLAMQLGQQSPLLPTTLILLSGGQCTASIIQRMGNRVKSNLYLIWILFSRAIILILVLALSPHSLSTTGADRCASGIAHPVLNTAPRTDRPEAKLFASGRSSDGLIFKHTINAWTDGIGLPVAVAPLKVRQLCVDSATVQYSSISCHGHGYFHFILLTFLQLSRSACHFTMSIHVSEMSSELTL